MGGANMVLHAAGWLGGGLTASFEKLILDAEMLQMMAAYFEPFEVSTATLALDAIREVGPAGHFFGTAHTMERYETRLLCAAALQLGQSRHLGRARQGRRRCARQHDLEEDARRVRAAADRSRHRRGLARLRQEAKAGIGRHPGTKTTE